MSQVLYEFDGYVIDKTRVAYYAFGDKTRTDDVEDFVCQDAVYMLEANLESIKSGLSDSVIKSDPIILTAVVYFTACLIVQSGNAIQRSGLITTESMSDKSVSYESLSGQTMKAKSGRDWCSLAKQQLELYAKKYKFSLKGYTYVSISNYNGKLLNGIYNKHTEDDKWGGSRVPFS